MQSMDPRQMPPAAIMPTVAMIPTQSAQQVVDQQRAAALEPGSTDPKPSAILDGLAAFITKRFERAQSARQSSGVEERMLDNLRRARSQYSPDMLAKIAEQNAVPVFVGLTETKCSHAESWLVDTLLQPDDKLFSIGPTPISDLPKNIIEQIIQDTMSRVMQDVAAGGKPMSQEEIAQFAFTYAAQMRESMLKQVQEVAKQRAEGMEKKIVDQVEDSGFADAFCDFITNLVTFGTGLLEGPLVEREDSLEWGDSFEPKVIPKIVLKVRAINPLDFYPSEEVTDPNQGYNCTRVRFTVRDLEGMKGGPGAKDEAIDRVISLYGETGYRRELSGDAQRRALTDNNSMAEAETIEGIKFRGTLMGRQILDWDPKQAQMGVSALKSYDVCATMTGPYVIHVALNYDPLHRRNVYKAVYKKVAGSFWGKGPPELMKYVQDKCNGAIRALLHEMATGGTQVVYDLSVLPPGQQVTMMYRNKVWLMSSKLGYTGKGVDFFKVPNSYPELTDIYEKCNAEADNVTLLPSYVFGSDEAAGAAATASGLGMLMNASLRNVKRIVKGIDVDVIKRLIERLFVHNMLYDQDTSIKGDVRIVAKGAIGLMMKEQQRIAMIEFLMQTANPIDQSIVGPIRRGNALRERAKGLGPPVDDLVPTKEEQQKELMAQQAAAIAQMEATAARVKANGGKKPEAQPA